MSVHNRNIKDAAGQLGGVFGTDTVELIYCTVGSVDIPNCSCSCTPISGKATTGLENVLLKAEANDGFMLVPSVGSTVVVGISSLTKIPFVMLFEDVDQVLVKINQTLFSITDGLTKFNNGSNGGLTNTPELKTQLDKNNQILTALLNILTGPTINEPGNGAPSALQTALNVALAGKAVGDFSQIEDTKVTH